MAHGELEHEREYLLRLYSRLAELGVEAGEQLTKVLATSVGSNHQSMSERDALARLHSQRLEQLAEVGDRLAFGKLILDDGSDRYIGRIGLLDEDYSPMLLDWRVPQASAFYQATAVSPMGVAVRRQLSVKGRELRDYTDEVLDRALLSEHQSDGESALLAAVNAERSGQMTDIVATIQAEQDRIIRSDLKGVLVVQGGPGTGKTAVALHRAAYLLYTYRKQLSNSGVLVVGPSRAFLNYIEAVLPSLGENGVVLQSLGQLYPGIDADHDDNPEVARVKGAVGMAELLRKAVRSRQIQPDSPIDLDIDGESVRLEPSLVAEGLTRARDSHKPHNEARIVFVKYVVAGLTRALVAELRSRGTTIDEADVLLLAEDVRSAYDVRVALNTAWMPLTPEKLLMDLYARPHWLEQLTPHWSAERRRLLYRTRGEAFTVSDAALLDEAAELLGDFDQARARVNAEEESQRARDIENAERAIENMGVEGIVDAETLAAGFAERAARLTTAEHALRDRSWSYGHIIVDEAQELSPMQWRVLARRGPLRSFTVVGDLAQARRQNASSWRDLLGQLVGRKPEGDGWHQEELTVNYRTPAKIAHEAEEYALARKLPITRATPVRDGEWPVVTETVPREGLLAAVGSVVQRDAELSTAGILAVIAPAERISAITSVLESAGRLDSRTSVITAEESKGLEFDAVVLVDPQEIEEASWRGSSDVFVAMTRATQRLWIVKPVR